MSEKPIESEGWWYQAVRERDGFASTTKVQRLIAFVVCTVIIIYQVVRGSIPTFLPELLGVYLSYAVLGRVASQWADKQPNKGDQ